MVKALEIIESVKAIVEPELTSRGLEIVDVEYKREPIGRVLRFYIDGPQGINLDTCSEASAVISDLLDRSDILKNEYTLEVSSPGIERRLTKPAHFMRFVGETAAIKTGFAHDGRKKFTGVLSRADEAGFTLDTSDGPIDFEYGGVTRANLVFTAERRII